MAGVELHDEIVDWMSSLDDADWNRTVVAIDRLAGLGSTARMPFSRALGDGLFELRFSLGPTARPITYRFTTDNRIILLTPSASNATTSEPRSPGLAKSPRNALGSTRRST